MFYNSLKNFIKKFPNLWNLLRWLKDSLIKLSRLKDVLMMMIMFHIWPEQTYRFSTRRHLPCKKNRFSRKSRPIIPYELLKSKSSKMPIMKEINVVGVGSSFDLNNLLKLKGPIFIVAFWQPLRMDDNGKIVYKHDFSKKTKKLTSIEEPWSAKAPPFLINKNITYVHSKKYMVKKFSQNGCNVLSVVTHNTDKDGNLYSMDTPSYLELFDYDRCRIIAVSEKIYKPPLLAPYLPWTPTKSFIPEICALSFFAEKINVYGWDYYLDSSPENMSYWRLFFNMYNYKFDLPKGRGKDHFESALLNFYYGYHLSKLPNIKIHGYMGKLRKHHKLIQRIERVLFN